MGRCRGRERSAESLELEPDLLGRGSGGTRRLRGRWWLAGWAESCEARAWAHPRVAV
jgi:hypothetical protein